jgi:hypothetical protein
MQWKNATLKVVGEFPVRAIREVQEDGTDINAPEHKKINKSLELGDPRILWSIVL